MVSRIRNKYCAIGWAVRDAWFETKWRVRREYHRVLYCRRGEHTSRWVYSMCSITRIGDTAPYWSRTRDIERCVWCDELLTEVIRTKG